MFLSPFVSHINRSYVANWLLFSGQTQAFLHYYKTLCFRPTTYYLLWVQSERKLPFHGWRTSKVLLWKNVDALEGLVTLVVTARSNATVGGQHATSVGRCTCSVTTLIRSAPRSTPCFHVPLRNCPCMKSYWGISCAVETNLVDGGSSMH